MTVVAFNFAENHLDGNHTCFGKVYEGLEVIDSIKQGDEIEKIVIVEE